jgi:hypothetical protein
MPRFSTLSEVISNAIDTQVPKINFPEGSILNQQIGRIPYLQTVNDNKKTSEFVWGFATWGLETVTSTYKPEK